MARVRYGRRLGRGAIPLVRDSFNRADSAVSLGSAESGHAWTAHTGTWGISGSQGYAVAGAATARATLDAGVANGFVACVVNAGGAGGRPAVIVRYTNNSNYLYVSCTPGSAISIRKVVAGVESQVAAGSLVIPNAADVAISLSMRGDALLLYANGVLEVNTSDSHNNTATRVGLLIAAASPTGVERFDIFRVFQ